MTNFEAEDGTTRDILIQRLALMEAMIAEGRQSTARFGWIFVLWGVVEIAGLVGSSYHSTSVWVWPVTLGFGFVFQFIGIALRKRAGRNRGENNMQARSVAAVWSVMGLANVLYTVAGFARHLTWQISFVAAILMFVGLAHAVSAVILRWRAQGMVAAIWWAGGVALFFVPGSYIFSIIVAEMFFGMVLFGLYAMMLERHEFGKRVSANA